MKCSELFEKVRTYWPDTLEINRDTREKMNSFYWQLDSTIDHDKDHWLNIGFWAYHQALDIYMKEQKKEGRKVINASEIPMILFNKQMLFNLKDESWAKERAQYIAE